MHSGAHDPVFGPGIGRVTSLAVPQGTAILADWSQLRLLIRQGASTLAATQAGELFQRNEVLLRAGVAMRCNYCDRARSPWSTFAG